MIQIYEVKFYFDKKSLARPPDSVNYCIIARYITVNNEKQKLHTGYNINSGCRCIVIFFKTCDVGVLRA